MNGLAFYGGRLVISPGPDADSTQVEEFKASVRNFQLGRHSDDVLSEVVALAALCEQLFTQEEK